MIQIDEKELQILLDLASRTPKTLAEQYALEVIVSKCNAQQIKATKSEPQPKLQ